MVNFAPYNKLTKQSNMQKLILAAVMVFTIATAFAQVDSAKTTTTVLEKEDPSRDRFLINVHWDGWMGAPDSMKIKGLSSGIGLHYMYDVPLKDDNISFAIGAGVSWSNYYNNSYFTYDTSSYTVPVKFADTVQYSKNKFVLNYVEVPLEFRFRTDDKNGNRFKAAIGFKAGYAFSNHTKYVGDDYIGGSGDEIKFKQYRVKNVSTLQYGPTLRLGYSKINIEAYYGLAPIFIDGEGPTGNPITVGVSFNPF